MLRFGVKFVLVLVLALFGGFAALAQEVPVAVGDDAAIVSSTIVVVGAVALVVVALGSAAINGLTVATITRSLNHLADSLSNLVLNTPAGAKMDEAFNRLQPSQQATIRYLMMLAEGGADMLPGDIDNRIIEMLKPIVDGKPGVLPLDGGGAASGGSATS